MAADLFGQEVKLLPRTGGYAGTPGTGPTGQSCFNCAHYVRMHYHNKVYPKCELVKSTHGKGTDIKAHTAACSLFEECK